MGRHFGRSVEVETGRALYRERKIGTTTMEGYLEAHNKLVDPDERRLARSLLKGRVEWMGRLVVGNRMKGVTPA